jgi:periplasmic protein TonB
MPPTSKITDLSSSETSAARPANAGRSNQDRARQQTVALEVPVTVNGARPVEGSDKREPFSEATKTVLVHSTGAVIRLSSTVLPGQLLFLTNDKTKKEMVCQVLKSKNDGSVSGYVELEFTEPAQGFWGLGFPGERSVPQPASPAALPPSGQNLDSLSSSPSKSVDQHSAYDPAASQIPTVGVSAPVEEFKTEIKQDSRPMSKADFLTPSETSTQSLKMEAGRLQEQLSSLLFVDPAAKDSPHSAPSPTLNVQNLGDTAAQIFETVNDAPAREKTDFTPVRAELLTPSIPAPTAPLSATPAFDAEEVKIPAWLEPLARNAAIPAPPEPPAQPASGSTTSDFEELNAAEPKQPAPVRKTRKVTPAGPVFGRTLLATSARDRAKAPAGNKRILIIAIAAGILLAAAGATWYLGQSPSPVASSVVDSSSPISMSAAALPATTVPSSAASNSAPTSNANATTDNSAPEANATSPSGSSVHSVSSSSSAAKLQPATISERVPKPAATGAASDAAKTPSPTSEEAEPEIKRPSLGNVRLAKPKVNRSARTPLNGDAEPTLEAGDEQLSTGESPLSGALLEGGAKQPAAPTAPVPVGGDVKPARMISSVPPTYPMLARTQHVSGDVRIDALIDANGRVSTMKVVSGPTLLHQAAMDALRQWKYQPAALDGKPVAMHLTVTLQFRLQ